MICSSFFYHTFLYPVNATLRKAPDLHSLNHSFILQELGYEIREYPASKWFCTEWTQKTDEADPFADWEDSGVSPYEVMSSAAYEERPDSKHFMKLFKYILGVNKEGVEIDMTRPVTTKITVDEEAKEESHRMCFWSGSPWAEKDLPAPIDNSIEFEDRPKTHVYVRRFSGWAIADNEWEKEIEALEASLEKAEVTDADESHVYTVGYDGPWTKGEDRTNEIWVTKMTPEETEGKKSAPLVEVEESTTERLPYESMMSNEEFELRKYPKSKWVCTKAENVDGAEDLLNGWQDTYDNNAMAAMAAKKRNYRKKEKETGKKDARHGMFKNLYQYISGVNSEYEEIEMTSPATIQHNVVEGSVENIEMCFWSGAEWNDKEMPEPIKKDVVYLVEKDEFYVYAK